MAKALVLLLVCALLSFGTVFCAVFTLVAFNVGAYGYGLAAAVLAVASSQLASLIVEAGGG